MTIWTRLVAAGATSIFALSGLSSMPALAVPAPAFTKATYFFHAHNLGPNDDTACDVIYDLYVPSSATASTPVPAIITTNGFGGSHADQADFAGLMASNGYEVLSYSGLGFGDTSCRVEVDSPEWDGKNAAELVQEVLAPRPEVLKHSGTSFPVLGTWGGSYGGGFQFALASVYQHVDAMVPLITWNDLAYSLIPNNDNAAFNYAASPPGVEKIQWSTIFFALGNAEPALHPGISGWTNTTGTSGPATYNGPNGAPSYAGTGTPPVATVPPCPGFDPTVCLINSESAAVGYGTADTIAFLRHASAQYEFFNNPLVTHFPATMLMQGETDTLFNIPEAVANYNGFKAKGAPVKLVLQNGGHSGGGAAGEVDYANPAKCYHCQLWLNWYDHYLKGAPVSTGPEVEYFKEWATYDTNGSAAPAYAGAPSWPVGSTQSLYLSGGSATAGGDLVSAVKDIKPGTVMFTNSVAPPQSYSGTEEVPQASQPAPTDPPGQAATYTTQPLAADVDSVGIPTVDFTLKDANPVSTADPALEVVLFGKVYDLDPSGTVTLVHRLVSPIRIADTSKPVHLNLPGVVHRYAKGHRIQLVLASTDQAYVGSRAVHGLSIAADPAKPAVFNLPVVSGVSAATYPAPASAPPAPPRQLPNTAPSPGPAWLLLLLGLGGIWILRRRAVI
jgi:MYXO-CTERM domain-containing protein